MSNKLLCPSKVYLVFYQIYDSDFDHIYEECYVANTLREAKEFVKEQDGNSSKPIKYIMENKNVK